MWLGAAKFGARTLRELADKGLITPREQAGADAALTFLWRVRNELHFFSGHKNDVLTRDLQPRIAKNLGYENEGDTLGVEQFMRVELLRRLGLIEAALEELEDVVERAIGDPVRLYGLSNAYARDERYHLALRIHRRHLANLAASGDPALPRAFWETVYPFPWRADMMTILFVSAVRVSFGVAEEPAD